MEDAWNAADKLTFLNGTTLSINIADGTYHIPDVLETINPEMANVYIYGNYASPQNVVLEIDNPTTGNLVDIPGIYINNGGRLGLLSGVTLTRPNNGLYDLSSGDFSTSSSAVWKNWATAIIQRSSTTLVLDKVSMVGFYNGILCAWDSTTTANNVTINNYGGVGIMTRRSSSISANGITVTNGSSSSNCSSGITSDSAASMVITNLTVNKSCYGVFSPQGAYAELGGVTLTNLTNGVIATAGGFASLSNATISNTKFALTATNRGMVDGDRVTITNVTTPIFADTLGYVILSNTLSGMPDSGSSIIHGDGSANGYSWKGGSAQVN